MTKAKSVNLTVQYRVINGHRRAYLKTGMGPPLLLLHGLGSDCTTWDRVIPQLARRFTVIAPDLLGHGQSAKPRADYSIGGYANGMRDLCSVLGLERVTVVGHSFGGGVAMQFAYQFPERCERVVLVGSGGLGPEVSPILRALSVPGAGSMLAVVTATPIRRLADLAAQVALAAPDVGLDVLFPALRDLPELMTGYRSLAEPAARSAFLHVLRAAVDYRGQVVTMLDRSYLAAALPVLIVWGTKDSIVPVSHARRGAAALPGSRLVLVDGAGHFPHREQPVVFVRAVEDFVDSTVPSTYDVARFRAMLRRGGSPRAPSGAMPASA